MAKIFKTTLGISNDTDFQGMKPLVEAYWGTKSGEKVFILPYWRAKQMISASSVEEIALKVTDIKIPTLAEGEWVVLEEGYEQSIGNPTFRPNDYYFVINEELIEGIRSFFLLTPVQNLGIGGRLAKETKDDGKVVYRAFIYGYECKPIPPGGGTGGGHSGGAKIPANGED